VRMAKSLQGKVVLITGASSGFGADAARLFAREGCHVFMAARRMDRLEILATEIRSEGGSAFPLQMDVTKWGQIQAGIQRILVDFGRVDILFNNAGFGRLDWLERLDPKEDIEAQIAVNLTGMILAAREVLKDMLQRRSGTIINMSSMAGWIAPPIYSIYAATKHGVRGFTDALRREVLPFGIHVCGIYPAGASTEFGQHTGGKVSKRLFKKAAFLNMTSEYVAKRVVDLAKHPRSTLIVPGWFIPVIWLERNFQVIVDWILKVLFVKKMHTLEIKK
jgi:NADP-dependent 3-hydroxy acid dehydrogenase YdfG